jgi:methylated-DNA-protein-cysteine methyltransferase related protein
MSDLHDRIYAVIRKVPKGKVATYGQIAQLAGIGPHARMVGYALHALTPDKRVPWHRIVGAGGIIKLPVEGAKIQRSLLKKDGVLADSRGRIPMDRFGWRPRR